MPNCLICNGPMEEVFLVKDHLVSQELFQIVECSSCQLRMTNPIPPEDKIGEYYDSDDYISHEERPNGLFEKVYSGIRAIMLCRKKQIIKKLFPDKVGILLDIGCGAGHFLSSMAKKGWQTRGVDASSRARELAHRQFGLQVDSPAIWLKAGNEYDIITAWHSLEHVHYPEIYFQKINASLKPEGWLVVAVPNYQSTDGDHYKSNWAAYDVPRHLYHFSVPAFGKITNENGFEIQGIKRLPFDAFYVSLLSEKQSKGKMINGLGYGMKSWLESIFNKRKCSSLIYILKKKTII